MHRTWNTILLLSPKHGIPFPFLLFLFGWKGCIFACMTTLQKKIIIPHFVLWANCAEVFYRVLEVEREGGCGGSTIKTGSTEYR